MRRRRILVILDGSNSRYICSCGDEDKAFQRDIGGRANNHNTRRHKDEYELDTMEVVKELPTVDLEEFKKNWAETSGRIIGEFVKKIETKEIK